MELLKNPEIWVAVAFVILVAGVWKPVKRGVAGGLDARAATIKAELDEARRLKDDAEALLAEYQQKESQALAEAEAILRHAGAEAERNRRQAEGELAASLKRREQQAMERIAQAEAKAIDEVRALAVALAVAVTRRLVAANLDGARAAALVDSAIAELPQRLN